MKKILSIDGGGIRGIIPAQILVALEEKIQKKTNNPDARISNYFDFFAGSSTGGLLIALLLCRDEYEPKKPKFSTREALDLYQKYGNKIFKVSFLSKLLNYKSLFTEKYRAEPLENILDHYFGDARLSELLKPCLITAYNIQERKAHFFASHDYSKKGDCSDFYVRELCRATSAAPTYFEAAFLRSIGSLSYALIDGGIFANNPALCAYSEVRNSIGDPTAKDMLILSLGTGSENKSYPYKKAKRWGALGWIKPSIDIMMSAASETTDYHLVRIFSAGGNQANYCRIQPKNLRGADPEMDHADDRNIQALLDLGFRTAYDYSDELDAIVDRIIKEKDHDPVKFE